MRFRSLFNESISTDRNLRLMGGILMDHGFSWKMAKATRVTNNGLTTFQLDTTAKNKPLWDGIRKLLASIDPNKDKRTGDVYRFIEDCIDGARDNIMDTKLLMFVEEVQSNSPIDGGQGGFVRVGARLHYSIIVKVNSLMFSTFNRFMAPVKSMFVGKNIQLSGPIYSPFLEIVTHELNHIFDGFISEFKNRTPEEDKKIDDSIRDGNRVAYYNSKNEMNARYVHAMSTIDADYLSWDFDKTLRYFCEIFGKRAWGTLTGDNKKRLISRFTKEYTQRGYNDSLLMGLNNEKAMYKILGYMMGELSHPFKSKHDLVRWKLFFREQIDRIYKRGFWREIDERKGAFRRWEDVITYGCRYYMDYASDDPNAETKIAKQKKMWLQMGLTAKQIQFMLS